MPRPTIDRRLSRGLRIAAVLLVAGCMAWGVSAQGPALLKAARSFHLGPLVASFVLCLVHRVINARGWAMLLGALNCPIEPGLGARIWLASESSRWIPGSVWSYGSRGVIASRRGVPAELALASLVYELLLTVAAWTLVAVSFGPWLGAGLLEQLGGFNVEASPRWISRPSTAIPVALALALGVAMTAGIAANRWELLRARLRGLKSIKPIPSRLAGVVLFLVAMAALNGLALAPIARDLPGGAACPLAALIAANAVSWIIGFITPVAPGGLVVREACLASLLSPWMSVENALAVALAWRLIQVAAEATTFLGVAAMGLDPDAPLPRPGPSPSSLTVEP